MTNSKEVQGVIIKPDGTHIEKVFKQLTDYQDAIDGEVACAYVDDEGLPKHLPLNPLASAISFLFGNTPYLTGNVVIVGKSNDEGNDTDIPEYLSTLIKNISAKQEAVS